MTIAAAYAAHSSILGEAAVGLFADSRASNPEAGIRQDDQQKIRRLNDRCYTVAAGPSEPFLRAVQVAEEEIAGRDEFRAREGLVPLGIYEYAGVLLRHLRYERSASAIQPSRPNFLLIAGFTRDGTPAVVEVTLQSPETETRFLYIPKPGEVVARVVGPQGAQFPASTDPIEERTRRSHKNSAGDSEDVTAQQADAVAILAEALRMGIAQGLQFDIAFSVLRDMSQDPSLPSIGGRIFTARCVASGIFLASSYSTDHDAEDFMYSASAYRDLDTQHQVKPFFSGGQPFLSWLRIPPLELGRIGLFDDDEPLGLTTMTDIPAVMAAGPVAIPMIHRPERGLHDEERRSIERHRPARKEAPGARKRRR
ncbi:hypothetical protein WME99_30310 [Sorangium sp. So ce136]|uniref:hypothetical protein n=1 Tax=Sorangium sp. So ce136 TaxID=3133284 RepID=UPI003F12BBD8